MGIFGSIINEGAYPMREIRYISMNEVDEIITLVRA
jgi:hypothetical protein